MPNKFKSSGKVIPVDKAVGTILAHDITEIRPGQFKGTAFKKGQIISKEDLDHLRRLGKENLFILEIGPDEVHEDDAAVRLATALSGPGVIFDDNPSEGKIAIRSAHRGLLKVDVAALTSFNLVPNISCASRHNNILVEEGETIAATRAIPLIIDDVSVREAEQVAKDADGIFSVKRLSRPDTGLIITGNEVYSGKIKDKFAPLIRKKLDYFDCSLMESINLPDEKVRIVQGIRDLLEKGAELILVTGGMSVDPDDVSRMAIAEAGAEDILYGTPVLPGAMFLYARLGDVPVLGLPACVIFYRATVFDHIFPRVLAGERITREDLASMAHGGLCLNCDQCHYPVCPFGK
ncbi:MAG: molybdopterin-binding protein [Deltaproteobacteria bacterium]|nr:molybdopterin-binding protein [Deltaproteobacteria bacterium]